MSYEIFNPWVVRSIDSFNFLCCPECVFRSKEKSSFQSHAIENHPKSKVFFRSKQRETQKTGSNLFYCCPECVYKSEDVNQFQIHALEKHPSTSMAFFSKHDSGKSLSEALLCRTLCTKIVLNVRNNFLTQHVLPRFELVSFMY